MTGGAKSDSCQDSLVRFTVKSVPGDGVMALAIQVVRLLRKLPRTRRFDRHLDDCAALDVLYGPWDSALPSLQLSHVVRLAKLPSFQPAEAQPVGERTNAASSSNNVIRMRRRENSVVVDTA